MRGIRHVRKTGRVSGASLAASFSHESFSLPRRPHDREDRAHESRTFEWGKACWSKFHCQHIFPKLYPLLRSMVQNSKKFYDRPNANANVPSSFDCSRGLREEREALMTAIMMMAAARRRRRQRLHREQQEKTRRRRQLHRLRAQNSDHDAIKTFLAAAAAGVLRAAN